MKKTFFALSTLAIFGFAGVMSASAESYVVGGFPDRYTNSNGESCPKSSSVYILQKKEADYSTYVMSEPSCGNGTSTMTYLMIKPTGEGVMSDLPGWADIGRYTAKSIGGQWLNVTGEPVAGTVTLCASEPCASAPLAEDGTAVAGTGAKPAPTQAAAGNAASAQNNSLAMGAVAAVIIIAFVVILGKKKRGNKPADTDTPSAV